MEKIGCKKYGGPVEIAVAAEYYQQDNVCLSCPHFDTCKEIQEEQDGKAVKL
jgi:hypothetical protein